MYSTLLYSKLNIVVCSSYQNIVFRQILFHHFALLLGAKIPMTSPCGTLWLTDRDEHNDRGNRSTMLAAGEEYLNQTTVRCTAYTSAMSARLVHAMAV